MKNIAIFASGRGSNFGAIARAVKAGRIKANLSLLVCDNPKALVLHKAKRARTKIALIERGKFSSKQEFESRIIEALEAQKIDLIVLAGFMRILTPEFVQRYTGRIINIHPSLLPSFKGERGINDAFEYGVKYTGVTVHFVDQEMDHGPIICQKAILIEESDTLESLEAKIHKVEHKLYPESINFILENRCRLEGRRVRISAR